MTDLPNDHPSVRDISNPTFVSKTYRLPVTTTRLLPEEARVNHDMTPATLLEGGYIKRTTLSIAGQIKHQYLTPDFYVISNWRAYQRAKKKQQEAIENQKSETQNPYIEIENAPPIPETVAKRISETDQERFDRVTEKAIVTQSMLNMDEAFPDVGMTEAGGNLIANPAIRARQASVHGTRYQKEYILRTVHRLSLRRVPVDEIARMFDVKVDTVYKWQDELNKRLQSEASAVTLNHIAGDTLAFYSEIRALGLTTASTSTKIPDKVRGMEVALRAEQDKHKFLQVAGFYDTAKLGRDQIEDESAKKAKRIIEMTQNLLNGTFEQTDEDESDISDEGNVLL